jgi:integrase
MPKMHLRSPNVPPSLTGPIAVNGHGMPRYWATIWADHIMAGAEPATRSKALGAVDRLYGSVAEQRGKDCLDRLITNLDFSALESVLSGFLTRLRNECAINKTKHTYTWLTALKFVTDIMMHIGATEEKDHSAVSARLTRLYRLYSQLAPSPERPPMVIRALPAIVVQSLYDVFKPTSPTNPFRTERQRWRNQLIFLMFLHIGLRRGEIAFLPLNAVNSEHDPVADETRQWLNIDETQYEDDDPRYIQPSIKNSHSRRQLPISEGMLNHIDLYVNNYRGRCNHPYLFNTQEGSPLSLPRINSLFDTASASMSTQAKKYLANIRGISANDSAVVTPHDLRHTAAVHRLTKYIESGNTQDKAIEKLRVFFGWSPTSEMPRHYARAYFETALAEVWHDDFDSYIDTLRKLEGIQRSA